MSWALSGVPNAPWLSAPGDEEVVLRLENEDREQEVTSCSPLDAGPSLLGLWLCAMMAVHAPVLRC